MSSSTNNNSSSASSSSSLKLPSSQFNYPPKLIQDSSWIRCRNKNSTRSIDYCDDENENNNKESSSASLSYSLNLITEDPTLKDILQWTFDPLLYKKERLICVFPLILQYYHHDTKYNIPIDTLTSFSTEVMNHYKDVSYHNWYHTICVLHITFMLLTDCDAALHLNDRDIFAVLFGAFMHDVDHKGHNNEYENKTNSDLSQKYNQQSVLENNSLDVTWNFILAKKNCNVLQSFDNSNDTRESRDFTTSMKQHIKDIVLKTDFVLYHNEFVKSLVKRKEDADANAANAATKEGGSDVVYFEKHNSCHRLMLCQAIIKAADISNLTFKNFDTVLDWAIRVSVETKVQAEKEQKEQKISNSKKLPPTMKDEYDVSKSQIGFCEFCVLPFFRVLSDVLPKTKFMLDDGANNLNRYKQYIAYVDAKRKQEQEQQEQDQGTQEQGKAQQKKDDAQAQGKQQEQATKQDEKKEEKDDGGEAAQKEDETKQEEEDKKDQQVQTNQSQCGGFCVIS